MEEFIGFSLLALMVVIGGLGIKRLFNRQGRKKGEASGY